MNRILIVDDEPDVAELTRLFLDSLGYEADICLTCEESLVAMKDTHYWAVFCDYILPKSTGDVLYKRVKNMNSELARRFVIITGMMLDEELDSFLKAEQVKVINKPFKLEEIKEVLQGLERI